MHCLKFLETGNAESEQVCMSKCTHVIMKMDRRLDKQRTVKIFNNDKEIRVKT